MGGRAEGLYLPAASPHRNSCLSDCNRCRFTEGGETVELYFPAGKKKSISVSISFNFLLGKDAHLNAVRHHRDIRVALPTAVTSDIYSVAKSCRRCSEFCVVASVQRYVLSLNRAFSLTLNAHKGTFDSNTTCPV